MQPRDPSQMRVSDAERHVVAELLRTAAGEGRLDLDELDERLEATYAAKTYADLVPITADLPKEGTVQPVAAAPPVPVVRGPAYASSFAMMSETKRSGSWEAGPTHTAIAFMGSVVLDFREAQLTAREVVVTASALMGSVEVLVNARTQVVVEGLGIMGDFSESRAKVSPEVGPGSPVVRVRGIALMGAVNVKRKAMPGEGPRMLRRGR
jgi:hypothetical protein